MALEYIEELLLSIIRKQFLLYNVPDNTNINMYRQFRFLKFSEKILFKIDNIIKEDIEHIKHYYTETYINYIHKRIELEKRDAKRLRNKLLNLKNLTG